MEQIKKAINEVVESLAMNETDETEDGRELLESVDEAIDDYQGRELEPIADMQM